jgi:hypothetical protein
MGTLITLWNQGGSSPRKFWNYCFREISSLPLLSRNNSFVSYYMMFSVSRLHLIEAPCYKPEGHGSRPDEVIKFVQFT